MIDAFKLILVGGGESPFWVYKTFRITSAKLRRQAHSLVLGLGMRPLVTGFVAPHCASSRGIASLSPPTLITQTNVIR